MKKRLFEFAVLLHPTEAEIKDGKETIIVVDKKTILAADETKAGMAAVMQIPADYKDKLEQIEVFVRPF